MTKIIVILLVVTASGVRTRRANADIEAQNVVTVPPNCPDGQEYINGQCRDVWRQNQYDPYNVVSVLPNCPSGQQWINGQCRDVWRQQRKLDVEHKKNTGADPRNCPKGQQNIKGLCRNILSYQNVITPSNVVTISPNCAVGQEYIKGQCRDVRVWIRRDELEDFGLKNSLNTLLELEGVDSKNTRSADESKALIQNRNVISVPNQCPNGQLPDALGICRPVFD